jgi:hypothetical protein
MCVEQIGRYLKGDMNEAASAADAFACGEAGRS